MPDSHLSTTLLGINGYFMKTFRSPLSRLPQYSRFNYKPRYYDPEKEAWEQKKKQRLKMSRHALYKNSDSNVVGAFTGRFDEDDFFAVDKRLKFRQISGVLIIVALMLVPLAYIWFGFSAWIAILLCILLVFLYKKR